MKPQLLMLCAALAVSACAPYGYTRAEVVYGEPPDYEYVVPVDRVVVVTRDVLVSRGYVVYRVEQDGPNRVIWARRGDDEVVRVFATRHGDRVALRTIDERREEVEDDHGHGRGRHRGWVRRDPPREVVGEIDVRLRGH